MHESAEVRPTDRISPALEPAAVASPASTKDFCAGAAVYHFGGHRCDLGSIETRIGWSNLRELTINQNYSGRFDLSTFGARSEHVSTRFEFVTHEVLT